MVKWLDIFLTDGKINQIFASINYVLSRDLKFNT